MSYKKIEVANDKMFIVLLAVLLLLIASSHFVKGGYEDYISRTQTQTINGLFIILVFLRHFNQYVELNEVFEIPFLYVNSALGQLIVTTFMFYSGYGVMCSAQKNGALYIQEMPKKRILKTMVSFDGAILLYILMNLFLDIEMTLPQVLLSLIGWSGVGNSTWYIFAILIVYLITYISFTIDCKTKNNKILGLVISTLLIGVYMIIVKQFKDSQYYNTVLCYAFGLWFAYFKNYFDALVSNRKFYYLIVIFTALCFALSCWLRDSNLLINQAYYLLFVALVVLVSMRVQINSRFFRWCGENILGLYILQRLPMIFFQHSEWMVSHTYVYFLTCIVVTGCLCLAYKILIIRPINIWINR